MADENPESLDAVNAIKITEALRSYVKDLAQDIEEERTERSFWDDKIDRLTNLRFGIRDVKNFPWPKCANYIIPQIDTDINRIKPSYINLINVTPIVGFDPFGPEDIEPSKNKEMVFDWWIKNKVDLFPSYALGIDYLLSQGLVIFKISWKYTTRTYTKFIDLEDLSNEVLSAIYQPEVTPQVMMQLFAEYLKPDMTFEENVKEIEKNVERFRQGYTKFEFDFIEKEDDQVEVTPCNVREEVTFPIDTYDLNDARFIDYVFSKSKNDIKIMMRDEIYEEFDDSTIDSWASSGSTNIIRRTDIESDDDCVYLHETCCWYDVNGDGIEERCIVTWPDASPATILRFIELPYDHGQWPYVLIKRELNDKGVFSSRGVPELDEDFQNGLSTFFNQTVDNGTITNSPIIVSRKNTLTNPRNLRFIPGNAVETNGPTTDFEIRQLQNNSQISLIQQSQYLKSWADQRIGNITSGVTSPVNQPGQGVGGNKTKREIDLIDNLQSQTQSLDLQIFQDQMRKVYNQINALFDQFVDQEWFQMVTNEKPIQISRQEIQGKFNIVPNGRLDNSNPQLRAQKAFQLLQAFMGDPDIRQRELKKIYLDEIDPKLSKKIFKTDEEVVKEQKMMMQTQQQTQAQGIGTQLNVKKALDDLDIRKQIILTPIQGKQYGPG